MHFFLQGERGIGKSYLLREQLISYSGQIAGFGVSRLMENGKITGFSVYDVKAGFMPLDLELNEGTGSSIEHVFMYRGKRNLQVLEEIIARVEADSREDWCKMILLDEIGGIELTSQVFLALLQQILDCGKPCVGVWKSTANLLHTLQNHGLAGDYERQHQCLEKKLRYEDGLYTMTADNRAQCKADLSAYLGAFGTCGDCR